MTPPETDWSTFDRIRHERRREQVATFLELLRRDSVSQEPERVRLCADWLAHRMAALGLGPRVIETGGNPAVFGERRVPGATRTLLLYCHYDTKPIPLGRLATALARRARVPRRPGRGGAPIVPFEAVSTDALAAHRVYARGASDDKDRSGAIWRRSRAWTRPAWRPR
jgi:acetylornithine deacetylase/succinyl-diaminopimelate desuccinylase-like protein